MYRVYAESSAGVVIGGGPLLGASRASVTTSLDRAGKVSCEIPATDPDAAIFADDDVYIRIKEFRAGTWVTVGRGIIIQKNLDSSGKMLQLSGPSIEHELTRTHVGTLSLTDDPLTPEDPMAAADVLPAIIAYALPGWTTDGTPSGDVYYQFGDETVLAALIKIAEILGDHFRIDVEDRVVVWLPTTAAGFDAADSGVRAVNKGEPDLLEDIPELAILDGGLQVMTDDTDRITRLYPRGGGNAGARLYLNATTLFSAAGVGDYTDGTNFPGYTLHIDADPSLSYIKHTINDAAGRIDGVETFRDIAPLDDGDNAEIAAANQLLTTAHTALMRRLVPQKAYRLSLAKLDMDLPVGETLRVKVRHFIDDYKWIDEQEDPMVLDRRSQYEAGGGVRHEVEVTL